MDAGETFEVGDRLPVFRDGAPTEIEAVVTQNEDGLVQIELPPLMETGRYTVGGWSA